MSVVAPFGFYGWGNIGDEASLQGFAQLVRASGQPLTISVAAFDPRHTAHVEPSFRYFRYDPLHASLWPRILAHAAGAYAFPGGTPIADSLGDWPVGAVAELISHARRWGKAVVFIGVGVEGLKDDAARETVKRAITPYAAHWSVRSEFDRQRLLDWGAPADRITVAADMAWLLPRADADFGRGFIGPAAGAAPLIGVNLNAEVAVMARAPGLFREIAGALDALHESHGARPVFLFNEVRDEDTFDTASARQVLAQMKHADAAIVTRNDYLSPQQMMSAIGCCALTISTRYHFCLFSALQRAPFIALKRSDKVADLCRDLEWDLGAEPADVRAASLAEQAQSALEQRQALVERLDVSVPKMSARALLNMKALDVLRREASQPRRLAWMKAALAKAAGR